MEVVNVKNVIIKYIPEHIVVETYVLSQTATEGASQTNNAKSKSNRDSSRTNELQDDIYYISMDESLNQDSDDDDNIEADSQLNQFTEEEYLEVDDDVQELFIEGVEDVENVELVELELESQETNEFGKKGSMQILRDWFFDHLNVKLHVQVFAFEKVN